MRDRSHGNKKISRWLASWSGLCFTARRSIDITNYCELYFVTFFATKEGKKIQRISYQLAGLVKGLWHFNIRLESSDT